MADAATITEKKITDEKIVETAEASVTETSAEPAASVVHQYIDLMYADLDLAKQRLANFTDAVDVCGVEASPGEPFLGCLGRELERRTQLSAPKA